MEETGIQLEEAYWVYKVELNCDGSVSRYKAILVAKGYAQTYGIDYEETLALIAKMATISAIIVVVAAKGWILHQMDVENVFLHGDLQEEVYVELPPCFQDTGVTTDEIDKAVHKMIVEAGAYPSPLGYGGFPKSVCTSVNDCICHGIPDSRPLQDGDIVNIDVTVYLNGYHGDTSKTYFCGTVDDDAKKLVEVTRTCLDKAIAVCGPGVEFKQIGKAIHDYADKFGYGVVRHFVGHGVGKVFHSAPTVLHYRNNDGTRMVVGQTFTIEPMLTIGGIEDEMWDDNWTVVTADGSLSAQFEHTLLITEKGVNILTVA
ncbi:hypothetical protein L7F22_053332 [Adiantum nelumboides]|nr:hypothetical protein [Adiantum nelumboides]